MRSFRTPFSRSTRLCATYRSFELVPSAIPRIAASGFSGLARTSNLETHHGSIIAPVPSASGFGKEGHPGAPKKIHDNLESQARDQAKVQGSAAYLKGLWDSQKRSETKPTVKFYEYALAALAVHPDPLLRSSILSSLKTDWIKFQPEHNAFSLLGLVRDGQYELALDTVEELHQSGPDALPAWVYDALVLVYGQTGFIEEAFRILEHRQSKPEPVPGELAHFLLDACSSGLHYKCTKALWHGVSGDKAGGLIPTDGTVQNILNTAAAYGDAELAMQALGTLVKRNVQMRLHHFEPVIDAYVEGDDVEGALRALCIMKRAGLEPRQDSTRSLFLWLKGQPSRYDDYYNYIKALRGSYEIPTAVVNVKIEALCSSGDFARAKGIWDRMESLLGTRPNSETFRAFLQPRDAPREIWLEMAVESIREESRVPALSSKRLAEIANLAASEGLLDVSSAYLQKMEQVYSLESRSIKDPRPTEAAENMDDEWAGYETDLQGV